MVAQQWKDAFAATQHWSDMTMSSQSSAAALMHHDMVLYTM
jgi:hypothetical protein